MAPGGGTVSASDIIARNGSGFDCYIVGPLNALFGALKVMVLAVSGHANFRNATIATK